MKEGLMHYMHVAPLFIIVILSMANLVFKTRGFYSYLRKNHIGLQLLLVSMGVMSGAISHSHYGILGCNLCLIYSAILAWNAIMLLFRTNNVSKCQVSL